MSERGAGYWIVFDGPPGHEAGRFIEVENHDGQSQGAEQTGASWIQDGPDSDGDTWALGPWASEFHRAMWQERAERAETEVEKLHSWDGLLRLLDEHWPADIFLPGENPSTADYGDVGPRVVGLVRWVERLQAALAAEHAALERAETGAAAMRSALALDLACRCTPEVPGECQAQTCDYCEERASAIASDAGRGWVSPDAARLCAEAMSAAARVCASMHLSVTSAALDRALAALDAAGVKS